MTWTPENQLTIFDVLDNQKYLEPKHFDPEQTNPNFISYLKAHGKQVGDPYSRYEVQQWIDKQVVLFKQANGRSEMDMLKTIENWPEKLREWLAGVKV